MKNKKKESSNLKKIDDEKKLINNMNWFELLIFFKDKNNFQISLDQYDKTKTDSQIKTAPKNRWFNSIMSFLLASIFVLIGVIIVCLIVIFNK